MRIERHPRLNVWVREDGCIYLPKSGRNPAHWTYGGISKGYRRISIGNHSFPVHRLVLEAFVGPCPEGMECDHKNRDGLDNRVDNLAWVTHSENNRNKSSNDSCVKTYGVHSYENRRAYKTAWARESRKGFSLLRFADGIRRLVPLSEVEKYRGIPVKERIYEVA